MSTTCTESAIGVLVACARLGSVPPKLEPGQPALLGVTFIEERQGRAVVRLPNGTKTSVAFGALRPKAGRVHFLQRPDGGEAAWCQLCDWSTEAAGRLDAEEQYERHAVEAHHSTAS